ncbi:hypothetical protein CVT24_006440 [Panaeolus cyanescens]|uniref:CCHC-type domain-containing protein n=1 Tax=Panaeolus cyanescens TaxID=181874 RepID=A0A409VZ82_9AGAR|nr:hypothetical protein CVT24_006440 [Panaeolus cyanescens]
METDPTNNTLQSTLAKVPQERKVDLIAELEYDTQTHSPRPPPPYFVLSSLDTPRMIPHDTNPQGSAQAQQAQATAQPTTASQAPEPAPPTVEEVVTSLIQSNAELKAWKLKAEAMFLQYGEILMDIRQTLAKSREAPPKVTSAAASPSMPSTPNPAVHIPPHLVAHSTMFHPRPIKPNAPPTFNGDRAKGRAFLNACDAYYMLRPEDFRDTQMRIRWVLTYMTSDRAEKWADRVYSWERDNPGNTRFADWQSFEAAFKREFFPREPKQDAMNRLDSDSYWQRNRSLDAYIDEFYTLIREANLDDQRTLVRRFRRGLKPTIQDEIATRYKDRPADNDLEAWIEAAHCIEDNHVSNLAFRAGASTLRASMPPALSRKPVPATSSSFSPAVRAPSIFVTPATTPSQGTTPTPNASSTSHAPKLTTTTRWAHQNPSAGNPVPMDMDAARRQADLPALCHRCGQPGHFKAACPARHDVRILEEVRAQLDLLIARTEAAFSHLPEEDNTHALEEEEPEDFPNPSE